MRTDFCSFLLNACPCMQQYGNISYKFGHDSREDEAGILINVEEYNLRLSADGNGRQRRRRQDTSDNNNHYRTSARLEMKPNVAFVPIDMPD